MCAFLGFKGDTPVHFLQCKRVMIGMPRDATSRHRNTHFFSHMGAAGGRRTAGRGRAGMAQRSAPVPGELPHRTWRTPPLRAPQPVSEPVIFIILFYFISLYFISFHFISFHFILLIYFCELFLAFILPGSFFFQGFPGNRAFFKCHFPVDFPAHTGRAGAGW